MKTTRILILTALFSGIAVNAAPSARAEDAPARTGTPTNEMVENAERRAEDTDWMPKGRLAPLGRPFYRRYARFNNWLWERHHLVYVVAPTVMAQLGTHGRPNDFTANEQVRAILAWNPLRSRTLGDGTLAFDFLHVGQMTDTSGVAFALSLGINSFASDSAADANTVRALLWRQDLPGDVATLIIGHAQAADVDGGGRYTQDDTTGFISQLLSSNPTRQIPGAGTGFGLDLDFGRGWTLQTHVADAQGDGTLDDPLRLFRTHEAVVAAGLQVQSPFPRFGDGLFKLSGYRVPETQAGTPDASPSGWGAFLQLDQDFGDFGVFANAGLAEDRVGLVDRFASVGAVWKRPFGCPEDWLGLGFAGARPTATSTNTEFVAEAFWRIQLTPFLQLTPDVQLMFDPSFRPESDLEAVFTLRLRAQL